MSEYSKLTDHLLNNGGERRKEIVNVCVIVFASYSSGGVCVGRLEDDLANAGVELITYFVREQKNTVML